MDTIQTSDLPHSLSFLPSYSNNCFGKKLLLLITCQLTMSIITSIFLSYFLYKKLHTNHNESWKRAVEIMKPIGKRLQNVEKERIIWNSYVEWIEDYCSVYYGLLNYINWTVSDLDKLYKAQSRTLRTFSEGSVQTLFSDNFPSKAESSVEGGHTSDGSLGRTPSDDDLQFVTNFARVFANMKMKENERSGRGDEKHLESLSGVSTDVPSTFGTNEELCREEVDILPETSNSKGKLAKENQDAYFETKKKLCSEERVAIQAYEASKENELS